MHSLYVSEYTPFLFLPVLFLTIVISNYKFLDVGVQTRENIRNSLYYPYLANLIPTAIIALIFSVYYPEWQAKKEANFINIQRSKLNGFWILEHRTENTRHSAFEGMKLTWLVNLSVDDSLTISGEGQQIAEFSKLTMGDYPRELRKKSRIQGGLVTNSFNLSWHSINPEGKESMQYFEGKIKGNTIRGTFIDEAGYQNGVFCAHKIENFSEKYYSQTQRPSCFDQE